MAKQLSGRVKAERKAGGVIHKCSRNLDRHNSACNSLNGWEFNEAAQGVSLRHLHTSQADREQQPASATLPGQVLLNRRVPDHAASVGWIMHAHGTHGEVRVRPITDEPELRLTTVRHWSLRVNTPAPDAWRSIERWSS